MSKRRKKSRASNQSEPTPLMTRIVQIVWNLPRLIRIIIAGVIALLVTLMIGLIFYLIDVRFLLPDSDGEITFMLFIPVIASTVGELIVYLLGWRRIVDVQDAGDSAQNRVLWYLGVGLVAFVFDTVWFIYVLNVINSPI